VYRPSSYVQYDGYDFIGTDMAGGRRFVHCRISEGCCTKDSQEERDLCYRIHECNHNANHYVCAGEATCNNFGILGYDTNIDCIATLFELSRCPFRDCCQDAGKDMDAVRECADPAPDGEEILKRDVDAAPARPTVTAACLAEEDCAAAARRMGMKFSAGLFPTSGCFSKQNRAYFSSGTEVDMTKADLPGAQERIYCESKLEEESALCLTESECNEARTEGGISKFLSGNFPTHGCFKKGDKAYWGVGGSSETVSKEDLPGLQERIYCRAARTRPSIVLSKASTER